MPLDRNAVMTYVSQHWFTPCDDGLIYSYLARGGQVHVEQERFRLWKEGKLPGTGWKAVLLPDVDEHDQPIYGMERACFIRANSTGEEIRANQKPAELSGKFDIVPFYQKTGDHDGLVDCAHYVSRCLTKGGVHIDQPGVPGLVQELRARTDTRTLGLEVTQEQGDRILATGIMRPGDIVAYVHENRKTHVRGYQHSAIYTGFDAKRKAHGISCHTIARFNEFFFDDTWNIDSRPEWRFTLIHFSSETFPQLPQPLRLAVTQGTRTEVYDFKPNGHVWRARASSSKAQAFGVRPEDRGYWFTRDFKAFIFWPRTGQVTKIGLVSWDPFRLLPSTVDDLPATVSLL